MLCLRRTRKQGLGYVDLTQNAPGIIGVIIGLGGQKQKGETRDE